MGVGKCCGACQTAAATDLLQAGRGAALGRVLGEEGNDSGVGARHARQHKDVGRGEVAGLLRALADARAPATVVSLGPDLGQHNEVALLEAVGERENG